VFNAVEELRRRKEASDWRRCRFNFTDDVQSPFAYQRGRIMGKSGVAPLSLFLLTVCLAVSASGHQTHRTCGLDFSTMDFFRGSLNAYGDLRVGGDFTLEVELSPIASADNIEVKVITSGKLVSIDSSNPKFLTRAESGRVVRIQFPLRILNRGEHEIAVSISGTSQFDFKEKNVYYLKIDSRENSGCVRLEAPTLPDGRSLTKAEQMPLLRTEARRVYRDGVFRAGLPPGPAEEVVISGYFGYIDPCEGGAEKPVRYATVEVYEIAGGDTVEIGSSYTDADGSYEVTVEFEGTKRIFVRAVCTSAAAMVRPAEFYWPYIGDTDPHEVNSQEPSTWTFGDYVFEAEEASWQILDYLIDCYQWLEEAASYNRPQMDVHWPEFDYPGYDPEYDNINLPERAVWPWDRVVVLHEFGHALMGAVYGFEDWPQGWGPNVHYANSVSSEGFAFLEGWAEFIQCTVDDTTWNFREYEIGDPDGDGEPNILYTDIENNAYQIGCACFSWFNGREYPVNLDGANVEGAVASILWDVYDSPEEDDDRLPQGFNHPTGSIWQLFYNYHPQNINEYWELAVDHYDNVGSLQDVYYKNGLPRPTPHADVSVFVTEAEYPVYVPHQGGFFTYTLTIRNNLPAPQEVELWIGVRRCDEYHGPFVIIPFFLEANQEIVFPDIRQGVAGWLPYGVYDFIIKLGEYREEVTSKDGFYFFKLHSEWDWAEASCEVSAQGFRQVDLGEHTTRELRGLTPPSSFGLSDNYPNPFNVSTRIAYSLHEAGRVKLEIYNLSGRTVKTLVNHHQSPGVHQVSWDGKDESGREVSSGIYFYLLASFDRVEKRRMILLR